MRQNSHTTLRVVLISAVVVWVVLAWNIISVKSVAFDEPAHIGDGIAVLSLFDFRMNPEHPPLFKVLSCVLVKLVYNPDVYVAFSGIDPDAAASPWRKSFAPFYGFTHIFLNPNYEPQQILKTARIVPLLFGLLGIALAYCWGRELGKSKLSGVFSALMLMFYSEYLGYSCFVLMDVPLLVACAGISFFGWKFWKNLTLKPGFLFLFCVLLGSQIKLPAVIFTLFLLGVFSGLAFFKVRAKLRPAVVIAVCSLLTIYFGCWLFAGFRYEHVPPGAIEHERSLNLPPFGESEGNVITSAFTWLGEKRLLPETTVATWCHTQTFKGQREYFLLGQTSNTGWYHYFLVTIFLKTPLPVLLGILLLPVLFFQKLRRSKSVTIAFRSERLIVLLLPFFLLAMCVIFFRANLGHRYILFLYFPLLVLLGVQLARMVRSSKQGVKYVALFILLYQIFSCLFWFPHNSTYFNLIGGSPYKASAYLRGSSVDFGQDVQLLAMEMSDQNWHSLNLSLWGMNPPEGYGIGNYQWIDSIPGFPLNRRLNMIPDARIPTAISVNRLAEMRKKYPGLYDRKPDMLINSIAVFYPRSVGY